MAIDGKEQADRRAEKTKILRELLQARGLVLAWNSNCAIKVFAVLEASGPVRLLQIGWIDVVFCFFTHWIDLHPLGHERLEPFELLTSQRPDMPGLEVAARRRTTGRQQDVLHDLSRDWSVQKRAHRHS